MARAVGDCHVCGNEEVEIHLLATCDRCRAAAGRFSHQPSPLGSKPRRALQSTSYTESFCCSFCGRSPREARKIFSGPWSFICDGCVALAADAMREELGDRWSPIDYPEARSVEADHPTGKTIPGHAVTPGRDVTAVGRAPSPPPGRRTPRSRR